MLNAFYVMLGAGLWATDTLFRHPMIRQISPLTIVTVEHVCVFIVSLMWMVLFHRKDWRLSFGQFVGAFFVGALGSAVATLLFTASFQFVNPTVSILLQKIQPILVICMSVIFLGEKVTIDFFIWAFIAMTAAFFMSFPEGLPTGDLAQPSRIGVFFALGGAVFWAISTIIGKAILNKAPSAVVSFWRFLFGLITCLTLVGFNPQTRIELPFVAADQSVVRSIFWMALISGFLGVTIYYKGLSKIPASIATILELTFPLAAMWVNATYLDLHLTTVQLMAAMALLMAMIGVSRSVTSTL
ncbi:MAG: EamA family transporter [Bdellovibrionales bacterium]|nr:EamA family transporter [Bdellovibrionales bacterium]